MQYILGNTGQRPSLGNVLFYIGMWAVILYGYTIKKLWNKDSKNTVILNMCTFTNVLFFLGSFSYELIRIREYFSLFYIVAIVNVIYMINKNRLIVSNVFVILSIAYFFVYLNNWANNIDALTDTISLSAGNVNFEFNFKLFK